MPQNLHTHSYDKQICVSEGFGDQVSLCQPMDEGEEYELVNSMIDELNSKCGLELSHEFSLYRPTITSEPERDDVMDDVVEKVVIIGGSHSSRLTDELDDTCLDVTDISVRGWNLTEGNVKEKVRELKEIVATADEKKRQSSISFSTMSATTQRSQMEEECSPAREEMGSTMWRGGWT
jgi:hypothetical protein